VTKEPKVRSKTDVYKLWCWIGTDWSLVRLYAYYIPIWIFSFLSIMIYIAVGYQVFHARNMLRDLVIDGMKVERSDSIPYSSSEHRGSSEAVAFPPVTSERSDTDSYRQNLTGRQEFYGTAVTEVQITREEPRQAIHHGLAQPATAHTGSNPPRIQSWVLPGSFEQLERTTSGRGQRFETVCTSDSTPQPSSTVITRLRAIKSNASLKLKRLDPVKMAYLRTSFIFGFAVLITWIPSSINRLYSLTHGDRISFSLSVASGCVLPLQGFWNTLIYFTTSWKVFCEEVRTAKAEWLKRPEETDGIRLNSRLGTFKGDYRDTFERTRQVRAGSTEDAEKSATD
jgi:hypothetical protein